MSLVLDAAAGLDRALAPTTGLAGMRQPRRQCIAQTPCVLCRQVDFVLGPVESETDGLVGCSAVEIVFENDLNALCHALSSSEKFKNGYLTQEARLRVTLICND